MVAEPDVGGNNPVRMDLWTYSLDYRSQRYIKQDVLLKCCLVQYNFKNIFFFPSFFVCLCVATAGWTFKNTSFLYFIIYKSYKTCMSQCDLKEGYRSECRSCTIKTITTCCTLPLTLSSSSQLHCVPRRKPPGFHGGWGSVCSGPVYCLSCTPWSVCLYTPPGEGGWAPPRSRGSPLELEWHRRKSSENKIGVIYKNIDLKSVFLHR